MKYKVYYNPELDSLGLSWEKCLYGELFPINKVTWFQSDLETVGFLNSNTKIEDLKFNWIYIGEF